MNPDSENQGQLIRVGGPLRRVKLTFKPVSPSDGPVADGPLTHVRGPLVRRALTFVPAAPQVTVLVLPLVDGQQGDQTFATCSSLIQNVNKIESLNGRAGVWVDASRSGVREGKVEIVLAPNDPRDAIDTCMRVAKIIGEALRNSAA